MHFNCVGPDCRVIEQCLLDPKCLEGKSISHKWVVDREESWCNEIICNIVEAGSTQVIEYEVTYQGTDDHVYSRVR